MEDVSHIDPKLVDLGALGEWMDGQGLTPGPIQDVTPLAGGTQNVLLRFERGGRHFVLRRPPLHKRRNSDETMRREARVLAALAGSDVPHPGFIAGCGDVDVLGAAFYLMEPVDGFNPTTGMPEPHASQPALRHRIGLAMVDAAASLGRIDYGAVGLGDFGKLEGYLERQVGRWRSQLESYSEFEGYPGPEIPGVEAVGDWLDAHCPATFQPGIIHGDYHLANVMVRHDSGELAAIVDWELSTQGDPLLDLGWVLATWPDPDGSGLAVIDARDGGYATSEELVARYAEQSGRDLADLDWWLVLACYKMGIILEGSHARASAGKAPKNIGDLLHASTLALFARAVEVVEGRRTTRR